MKMFFMLSTCLLGLTPYAQAIDSFHPNNCNDGGVYRSLVGPEVEIDAAGTKRLSSGGQTLIECKVGNTTTCKGTTFNDYTCSLNIPAHDGEAAEVLQENVKFQTVSGDSKSILLTRDNTDEACGHMHCIREASLLCEYDDCQITSKVSGWDE